MRLHQTSSVRQAVPPNKELVQFARYESARQGIPFYVCSVAF